MRVGLLGVAQVQLALETSGIAGLRQHLGQRDVLRRKPCVLDGKADLAGAGANRKLSAQYSRVAQCTTGFGQHA